MKTKTERSIPRFTRTMSRIQRQKAEKLLNWFVIQTLVDYPDHMYD
jgi:hypothetical protein